MESALPGLVVFGILIVVTIIGLSTANAGAKRNNASTEQGALRPDHARDDPRRQDQFAGTTYSPA